MPSFSFNSYECTFTLNPHENPSPFCMRLQKTSFQHFQAQHRSEVTLKPLETSDRKPSRSHSRIVASWCRDAFVCLLELVLFAARTVPPINALLRRRLQWQKMEKVDSLRHLLRTIFAATRLSLDYHNSVLLNACHFVTRMPCASTTIMHGKYNSITSKQSCQTNLLTMLSPALRCPLVTVLWRRRIALPRRLKQRELFLVIQIE